jgi:hypothetical protein
VKILAFILSIIVATALLMGGAFLLILTTPGHEDTGFILAATLSLTVFVYGPLTIGSLTAYWDVRNSPESRRYYSLWFWITLGLEVLAAITLITFSLLASSPIWAAILIIVVGAALTTISPVIGRALLRYDRKRRPEDTAAWTPITRAEIAKKVRAVGITFLATLLISVIGLTVLGSVIDHKFPAGEVLSFAAQFAFIAGAMACIIVTIPLNRRVRESVTRDIGLVRKIGRVVLRGKSAQLTPDEEVAAAKYSVVMPITLSFALGYITLLYVGIGIGEVRSLSDAYNTGLDPYFIGIYIVLLLVLFPVYILRIRRARRYAREHADLLPTGNPAQLLTETDR